MDGTIHGICSLTAVRLNGIFALRIHRMKDAPVAERGVTAGPDGLKFAYGFRECAFSRIEYQFSA